LLTHSGACHRHRSTWTLTRIAHTSLHHAPIVGIDFDLVQCGAEALAKIKGVFSSLGKKKKAQSEDDDESAVSGGNGKVDTYSAFLEQGAGADDDAELQETDEQEHENQREARAAEEQAVLSSSLGRTSGVESGMGDALKEKPCRRLNAFGSVLIDLTAANPIVLTVMKYVRRAREGDWYCVLQWRVRMDRVP
jgi:hypothetical protein